MTWRKDKILKIKSKEVLENGNDLTFFDISIIKNLVDFGNIKKNVDADKNEGWQGLLQVKTLKNQEHYNYEGTPRISIFIHSSLICRKAITTLYIKKN